MTTAKMKFYTEKCMSKAILEKGGSIFIVENTAAEETRQGFKRYKPRREIVGTGIKVFRGFEDMGRERFRPYSLRVSDGGVNMPLYLSFITRMKDNGTFSIESDVIEKIRACVSVELGSNGYRPDYPLVLADWTRTLQPYVKDLPDYVRLSPILGEAGGLLTFGKAHFMQVGRFVNAKRRDERLEAICVEGRQVCRSIEKAKLVDENGRVITQDAFFAGATTGTKIRVRIDASKIYFNTLVDACSPIWWFDLMEVRIISSDKIAMKTMAQATLARNEASPVSIIANDQYLMRTLFAFASGISDPLLMKEQQRDAQPMPHHEQTYEFVPLVDARI